jgi:hypothetical protein
MIGRAIIRDLALERPIVSLPRWDVLQRLCLDRLVYLGMTEPIELEIDWDRKMA